MKKIISLVLVIPGVFSFTSCSKHKFTIIKDYLVELPTYKSIDYDYATKWFKHNPFGMGGCSAVAKDVGFDEEHPHIIVGRNMDYGFSHSGNSVLTDTSSNRSHRTVRTVMGWL